jgi:hypothetical protein
MPRIHADPGHFFLKVEVQEFAEFYIQVYIFKEAFQLLSAIKTAGMLIKAAQITGIEETMLGI